MRAASSGGQPSSTRSQDGMQVVGAVAHQRLRELWVKARLSQVAGAPAHDEVFVMAFDRVSSDRPHELLVTSARGFLPARARPAAGLIRRRVDVRTAAEVAPTGP